MHDRRVVPLSLLLAAALLLLPVASHAQSFNGSVSGTVLDPSGSAVPGVSLTLKNTGTGVELRRQSETSGSYAFRNLVPGTYELTGEIPGFQAYVRRGILVAPNGDVRLDVGLTLGGQTESVEVTGASAMQYDSGAHDLDLLGLSADGESDLEADVAVRGHQEAPAREGLEARDGRRQLVGAGDEVAEGVGAARLGRPAQLHAGARVLQDHLGPGDGSSGRIHNGSADGAVEALRMARDG